jgi:hypothetical protein
MDTKEKSNWFALVSLVSFVVIQRHDGRWKAAFMPVRIEVVPDR